MAVKAPDFTDAVRAEIVGKVQQLTNGNCPMGHVTNWLVMGGYSRVQLNADSSTVSLSGNGVPCAVLVCTQCGYLAEFALGVLGLLREESPPAVPE
jgi:hypothetical protein